MSNETSKLLAAASLAPPQQVAMCEGAHKMALKSPSAPPMEKSPKGMDGDALDLTGSPKAIKTGPTGQKMPPGFPTGQPPHNMQMPPGQVQGMAMPGMYMQPGMQMPVYGTMAQGQVPVAQGVMQQGPMTVPEAAMQGIPLLSIFWCIMLDTSRVLHNQETENTANLTHLKHVQKSKFRTKNDTRRRHQHRIHEFAFDESCPHQTATEV